MAYQARLSDYVRGGVLAADLQDGVPVTFTQSGVRNNELPAIVGATASAVNNIGILFKGPDDFSRPTDARMYTVTNLAQIDPKNGYSDPVRTQTTYDVGKSTLWNPTLVSGELGLVMRGGSYAVPSGTFIDSAAIRVPGAMIRVGAGTKWEVTTTQAEAVGVVEEYNNVNQVLIFTLWH